MKQFNNQRKLKNYFVANKTQVKILSTNMILVVLVFAVITVMLIYPFYTDMSQFDDLWGQHYSAKFFLVLLERATFALGLVVLLVLLNNFFITHKVCGPLVNFSNTFEKISKGDLTQKIVLRKHDFLKDEARQVNEMITSLSSNIHKLKTESDLLLEYIDKVTPDEIETGEHETECTQIKKRIILCSQHLSQFKTSQD